MHDISDGTAATPKSWAHIVNPAVMAEMSSTDAESELCPFGVNGECRFGLDSCAYVHGDVCDLCGAAALHPTHQEQRRLHEFVSEGKYTASLTFSINTNFGPE